MEVRIKSLKITGMIDIEDSDVRGDIEFHDTAKLIEALGGEGGSNAETAFPRYALEKAGKEITRLTDEFDALGATHEEVKEKLSESKEDVATLEKALTVANERADNAESKIEILENDVDVAKINLDAANAKIAELEAKTSQ